MVNLTASKAAPATGRDRGTARIVLARPHDRAFAGDQRRRVAQLKLELHLRADRQRFLGSDEDAALADIDGVALDELLQRLALELDLERDRSSFPLSGIWIDQAISPQPSARFPASVAPAQDADLARF